LLFKNAPKSDWIFFGLSRFVRLRNAPQTR